MQTIKPSTQWRLVSGQEQLAASQPELLALAKRCGQDGAMQHLNTLTVAPYRDFPAPHPVLNRLKFFSILRPKRPKIPKLLLETGSEGLTAAVLLFEYQVYGLSTGAFIPVDADGWRTVVAQPEHRKAAAHLAAAFLLAHGARVVLISYLEPSSAVLRDDFISAESSSDPANRLPRAIAMQRREIRRMLILKDTYDATLATMGSRTRRNLRSAQRRAAQELGAEYYAHANLTLTDFLDLNRVCTYAVPEGVAQWRYKTASGDQGAVLAGLRAGDGRWLSLIGGRRTGEMTFIDWQMNLESSGSLSLGTAMRSFFLADEIRRGMSSLRFEGGTPHTIQNAFVVEQVNDLLFAQRWLSPRVLRIIAHLLPRAGLLADTLRSQSLVWRDTC